MTGVVAADEHWGSEAARAAAGDQVAFGRLVAARHDAALEAILDR